MGYIYKSIVWSGSYKVKLYWRKLTPFIQEILILVRKKKEIWLRGKLLVNL